MAFVLILPSAVGSWHFSHMAPTHRHWEVPRCCHLTTEGVKKSTHALSHISLSRLVLDRASIAPE